MPSFSSRTEIDLIVMSVTLDLRRNNVVFDACKINCRVVTEEINSVSNGVKLDDNAIPPAVCAEAVTVITYVLPIVSNEG